MAERGNSFVRGVDCGRSLSTNDGGAAHCMKINQRSLEVMLISKARLFRVGIEQQMGAHHIDAAAGCSNGDRHQVPQGPKIANFNRQGLDHRQCLKCTRAFGRRAARFNRAELEEHRKRLLSDRQKLELENLRQEELRQLRAQIEILEKQKIGVFI
eukprot:1384546-Amorphochlora_amoeboformis.AAC.1